MPADRRTPRRHVTTVAVCLAATFLLFTIASGDATDDIDRARALEADGRVDVAVEHLRALLADDSRAADPALLLELARLTENADEALVLADQALRSTRDGSLRARAHMMRADYLYAAGLYARAAAEYAAASERGGAPDDAALRHAASLLATGDVAGAVRMYEMAASSSEGDVAAWASIGRGRALLAGGDTGEAADDLERIADELVGQPVRAQALAAAAEARIAHDEPARARELLVLLMSEFAGTFESTLAEERVRLLDQRVIELDQLPDADTKMEDAGAAPLETSTP